MSNTLIGAEPSGATRWSIILHFNVSNVKSLLKTLIIFSIYLTLKVFCSRPQAQTESGPVLEQVPGHHAEGDPQPVGHHTLRTAAVDQELRGRTMAQLCPVVSTLKHLSVILSIDGGDFTVHRK